MTDRVRGFIGNPNWSKWVPTTGPEPSDLCLTQYLVGPSPLLAPYQTIQAAYAAAKAAGHGPLNPAQILVCPGTYGGPPLTMDTPGIDIIAVDQDSQAAHGTGAGATSGDGHTVFTGNLIIDPVTAGTLQATTARWQGIDIRPASGVPVTFGGVNNQATYFYLVDCSIVGPVGAEAIVVTNTGTAGRFEVSVLDVQRCAIRSEDLALPVVRVTGGAEARPAVLLANTRVNGAGNAVQMSDGFMSAESCVLFGGINGAVLVASGLLTNDCYIVAQTTAAVSVDEDSAYLSLDCHYDVSPLLPFIIGTGLFAHDGASFRFGTPPYATTLFASTFDAIPFESRVAWINTTAAPHTITSETNIAAYSLGPGVGTLNLPPSGSRPGVIRAKLALNDLAGVNVSGNGALIRLGGAAPAPTVPLTADGIFFVWNAAMFLWEAFAFGGAGVNCLGHYLVAPSATYAPYQSIQLAYNQAKLDGASNLAPAKILVCPGIYVEDVTMDTGGIDIIGVAKDPFNEWRTAAGRATTVLQGNLIINLTLGAQPLPFPRSAAWRGIDIEAPVEVPPNPAVYFTGVGFQRAYISDCQLRSSGTYVVVGDNSGSGGGGYGESTLDLIECGLVNPTGANGGAPPIVDWDDGRMELSDCAIFGITLDDSFDQEAGSTILATDCRIWGDWDTGGTVFLRQCSYLGTINLSDPGAQFEVLNCDLDTMVGGGTLVTGTGTFKYDQIPWAQGNLGLIALTVTQQQYESTPPGSYYVSTAIALTMTTESNVIITAAGITVTVPPATARTGPIRIKNNSAGAASIGQGAGTINGVALPFALGAGASATLVSDGVSNWETFA